MLFTKILPDTAAIDALSALATERSRRVFSFCADWLLDSASSLVMQYIVKDRPQFVFNVQNARPHMHRKVAFFYECGLDDAQANVSGKPAFDSLFDRMLACCLLHRDFSIWMHVNYEKEAARIYARLVTLGIPALLITGDCDDDEKERVLTDFDKESAGKQVCLSTAAVTVGINFKRNFSACIVVEGTGASGPVEAGQSAGRASRVETPECDFILWLIKGAGPPKPDEKLTPIGIARKTLEDARLRKARFAQRSSFALETVHPLLLEVRAINQAYEMDKRSHTSLLAHALVDYKPGWTRVDASALTLPPRLAQLTESATTAALEAATPLPLDQIQKIDSLTPEQKMALGYGQLAQMVQAKTESGSETFAAAEKDVLDTCDGMFAHAHLSDTFLRNTKLSSLDKQTVKAWKAARHFSTLSAFTPKQLLVVEQYEDRLNLAACHLSLGSRRVQLAREVLRASADGGKIGLYTRLPERVDALEQACSLLGVPCLTVQRQVLTEDSPLVKLLQGDKMGITDINATTMRKSLRGLIGTIACDAGAGDTKTLWGALRSLLSLVCVEVVVTQDRKMTVAEKSDWLARNDCEGGFLASKLVDTAAADEADAALDEVCGEPSEDGSASTATAPVASSSDAPPPAKRAKKASSQSATARESVNLRVPTQVELRRRVFYFDADGNLLDARKASCVKDGVYVPANQKGDPLRVTGVDFVAKWKVFSAEIGESVTTRAMLSNQMPAATVEHEIASLRPSGDEPTLQLTDEQRSVFVTAAAGHGIKRALHAAEKDGCVYMNEPIPAMPFERELKKLRAQKERFGNRLCSPQLLEEYRNASKADRKRLNREHEEKCEDWMGPKRTSQLLWLEAVNEKATQAAGGVRWLQVIYQKKRGIGRLTASYPSLQNSEGELRRKLMKNVAHDWDIVSCHCFLGEAVVRGFLSLKPEELMPTLYRYNCSRAADVLARRKSSENEFLAAIAKWYGVTTAEAKFGPIVVLNQGGTFAWLKELDPPRQIPAKGDHPDLISLQAEALLLRKLFFKHAAELFPRDAFEGLKQRLLSECQDRSLETNEKNEKTLFSYCMMHFESVALRICTDVAAKHGLPPLAFVYDGFLQLHVEGGAGTSLTVKAEAEAALLAHFKSPIYLTEKAFFEAGDEDDDGLGEMIVPPAVD